MKRLKGAIFAAIVATVYTGTATAQLLAAKDGPVVYGHHHLNVTSIPEQKKFWIDTLGGTAVAFGDNEIIKFPNVLIFMREQAPTGGTKGTTVNHVGFSVPNLAALLARVRSAGYPIVTREELPPALVVADDMAYIENQGTSVAFVMAPDDVKIEFVEDRAQRTPIALHHVHFAARDVEQMRSWYVQTLGATPGVRGSFQVANLPGVSLSYMPSSEPLLGTQGRSLDHVGFEIDGLEAFCKKLEAQGIKFDRPYTRIEARGIALAFFTDPFGTYIELTEGLDKL
jgi:catechol 2,3-dioxygenase-like lactoylglutathione lyase family enzyme